MSDHELIRQLIMTYTIEGDRGRTDALAACFAEDGILEMAGWRRTGPADIAKQLSGGFSDEPLRRPKFVRHNITSSLVQIDGADHATGRSYFFVVTDIGPDHMGVYVDRFCKIQGRWLFGRREVRIDWVTQASTYWERLSPMLPKR